MGWGEGLNVCMLFWSEGGEGAGEKDDRFEGMERGMERWVFLRVMAESGLG